MKLFISLFTLFNSSLLLIAQDGGQSGGGAPSGTAPAGQQPAQNVPAQTSPAQTSPFEASPTSPGTGTSLTQPGLDGTVDPAVGQQSPFGASPSETDVAPGTATPTDAGEPADGTATPARQTPAGPETLDIVTPPLTNSLPPPIRNSFPPQPSRSLESEVRDPSGASTQETQGGLGAGAGEGAVLPGQRQSVQNVRDSAFAQQFQSVTARDGTTQLAFPQENAMVTITSQEGRLTLQGTVDNEEQRENIEKTIRQISNAGFIDNQMEVAPRSDAGDERR